jgi:hypothetical protein
MAIKEALMRLNSVGILLLLGALGCGGAPGPLGTVDQLSTRIAISPAVLRPQDTAAVTVIAANRTGFPITFQSSCTGPSYHILQNGKRVDTGFCPIPEASQISVAPGDSVVTRTRFAVLQYGYQPVPTGTYDFVGGWDVGGVLRALSAPVVVQITP